MLHAGLEQSDTLSKITSLCSKYTKSGYQQESDNLRAGKLIHHIFKILFMGEIMLLICDNLFYEIHVPDIGD